MHKLSEKDLARRTGIRQATINGVCNNEVTLLSLKNSAAICETLEIEISDSEINKQETLIITSKVPYINK